MQTNDPKADDTLRTELDQTHETSVLINQFGAAVALQTSTGYALVDALRKNKAMRNQLREALEEPTAIAAPVQSLPSGRRDIDPNRRQKLAESITDELPRVINGMRERMNAQTPPPMPEYPASYEAPRYGVAR